MMWVGSARRRDGLFRQGEGERERDRGGIKTAYPFAAGAPGAWSAGATGDGVTVVVIDSGISEHSDFQGRAHARFDLSSVSNGVRDRNGHGTYVAGIIGGRGKDYVGIAPRANLLSLRVSGDDGAALASDVVAALQWTVDHKDEYGIRVVNISLTSTVPDSYKQDPLDAAVEQAWFHGIVVVVSAGNYGTDTFSADHAPANDLRHHGGRLRRHGNRRRLGRPTCVMVQPGFHRRWVR